MAPPPGLRAFWVISGICLALLMILPLVPLAVWSVADGWRFPAILPQVWSADAWRYTLSPASGVLASLWSTTLIALSATALSALIGIPAGRALGLHRFRGKAAVELVILAPLVVPAIAVALGLHAVFLRLGLTGTTIGVVLVHLIPALPYMTLVMAAVFANHDTAYEDQARSLGAGRLAIFRLVTLPAVLPGILAGAAFTFLVSWSQYALTLLIGSGKVVTLPLLLFSFASSGRNDIAGAIGVIYVLPGIILLALTLGRINGRNVALPRGGLT